MMIFTEKKPLQVVELRVPWAELIALLWIFGILVGLVPAIKFMPLMYTVGIIPNNDT